MISMVFHIGWEEQMRMPLYVWNAYTARAQRAINDTTVRAGLAAMFPHMDQNERRRLVEQLSPQRRAAAILATPVEGEEMLSRAKGMGILVEVPDRDLN